MFRAGSGYRVRDTLRLVGGCCFARWESQGRQHELGKNSVDDQDSHDDRPEGALLQSRNTNHSSFSWSGTRSPQIPSGSRNWPPTPPDELAASMLAVSHERQELSCSCISDFPESANQLFEYAESGLLCFVQQKQYQQFPSHAYRSIATELSRIVVARDLRRCTLF